MLFRFTVNGRKWFHGIISTVTMPIAFILTSVDDNINPNPTLVVVGKSARLFATNGLTVATKAIAKWHVHWT